MVKFAYQRRGLIPESN